MKKVKKEIEKISQEQFYDMLLSKELSWQEIIYDLINSEQLDPWDIDITLLASKYLERIKQLEEENFFLSSKILLAASIMLRIKSEMLLRKYIRELDDILFGKKEQEQKYERIFIDASELPDIMPRTPLPRFRKITLYELMDALERAVDVEQRRIKKEVIFRGIERDAILRIPAPRINIREKIKELYAKIKEFFSQKPEEKLTLTYLSGHEKAEKIIVFTSLLHLDHQEKILLEQEKHFDEIFVNLK